MRVFGEKDEERLRSNPLTRQEADEVYRKRRAMVVLSNLWLVALALASAALGFVGWPVALGLAALIAFAISPLTLYVFRREPAVQVQAGGADEP
jgi:hypothetical protein